MLLAVLAVFLRIASLCGGKEAQIPQDLQCEFGKQALEETVDFKFIEGYRAPVEGVTLEHLKELHMNFSTYRCKADTLNYQYLTPDDRHFDGRKFLSALKDRTLAMVGDSLGIQTFNALDSEIHPLLVHEKKHKGSHPDLWADIIGGEQPWQRAVLASKLHGEIPASGTHPYTFATTLPRDTIRLGAASEKSMTEIKSPTAPGVLWSRLFVPMESRSLLSVPGTSRTDKTGGGEVFEQISRHLSLHHRQVPGVSGRFESGVRRTKR